MESNRTGSPWAIIAVVLVVVLAGGGIVFWKLSNPERVSAPTAFTVFKAGDQSFQCEYPQGWQTAAAEAGAIASGALFQKASAKIDITADLAGSLMGDIARSSNQSMAGLADMIPGGAAAIQGKLKPPVQTLHEGGLKEIKEKFSGYAEQPAKAFQSKMGEARFSEFTADAGFLAGKLRGYRVTILGGDRRVTVLCHCSEQDWPNLQASFQRVVNSLGPG